MYFLLPLRNSLSGPGPPHYRGFTIILRHTTFGRTQRPLPNNTQHSQERNIHAPGAIRTRNPSKRAVADPRLRPRGHWDRLCQCTGLLTQLRQETKNRSNSSGLAHAPENSEKGATLHSKTFIIPDSTLEWHTVHRSVQNGQENLLNLYEDPLRLTPFLIPCIYQNLLGDDNCIIHS